jgi:hypothetical protein
MADQFEMPVRFGLSSVCSVLPRRRVSNWSTQKKYGSKKSGLRVPHTDSFACTRRKRMRYPETLVLFVIS